MNRPLLSVTANALAPPSAEMTAPASGCARSSTTTPRNSAGVTDASWRTVGVTEASAPCAKDVAGLLSPATITSTANGRTLTSYALRRHHREIDALGDRLARRLVGNLDFQPVITGGETDERHFEEIRDACRDGIWTLAVHRLRLSLVEEFLALGRLLIEAVLDR